MQRFKDFQLLLPTVWGENCAFGDPDILQHVAFVRVHVEGVLPCKIRSPFEVLQKYKTRQKRDLKKR